jgi:kynurenine formamidase
MHLVDLTMPLAATERLPQPPVRAERLEIGRRAARYTALVYRFDYDSMAGTYVDFPGHIAETDDGRDAANYPPAKLYRIDAAVIHLDRRDGSGGVSAAELKRACPGGRAEGGALIVNALGQRRFDKIAFRSVWLAADAVEWIVGAGIHLLVSDIYESPELHGVFPALFRAGICTVCHPVNLQRLKAPRVKVTVLPLRARGVTQLPCRALAEWE